MVLGLETGQQAAAASSWNGKAKVYFLINWAHAACFFTWLQPDTGWKVQRWLEPRALCGLQCQHSSPVPEVTG